MRVAVRSSFGDDEVWKRMTMLRVEYEHLFTRGSLLLGFLKVLLERRRCDNEPGRMSV